MLSPDGRLALAACGDKTARLWDVASGKQLPARKQHSGWVSAVALSPDGKQALSAGGQGPGGEFPILVWDTTTGKEVRRHVESRSQVSGVVFMAAGRKVVSGGGLTMWDSQTGATLLHLEGRLVSCLAVSRDGKQALTGGLDGVVRLLDLETGKQVRQMLGHTGVVKSVAFSPDGKKGLSGAMDKTVRLWDLEKGEETLKLVHPTGVHCAAFTDGWHALSGSGFRPEFRGTVPAGTDSQVRLWDLRSGEELAHYEAGKNGIAALVVTGDGQSVLIGAGWDLRLLELPK